MRNGAVPKTYCNWLSSDPSILAREAGYHGPNDHRLAFGHTRFLQPLYGTFRERSSKADGEYIIFLINMSSKMPFRIFLAQP